MALDEFSRKYGLVSSDYLWLHCLLSVIGVYGVCTILELIRQYVLENRFSMFGIATEPVGQHVRRFRTGKIAVGHLTIIRKINSTFNHG